MELSNRDELPGQCERLRRKIHYSSWRGRRGGESGFRGPTAEPCAHADQVFRPDGNGGNMELLLDLLAWSNGDCHRSWHLLEYASAVPVQGGDVRGGQQARSNCRQLGLLGVLYEPDVAG